MPVVSFTADFDWTDPRKPMVVTAYKAGMTLLVTTPCAAAAVAAGKAKRPEKSNATGSASSSG